MFVRLLNFSFLFFVFSLPFVQPVKFQIFSQNTQFTDLIFLFVAILFIIAITCKKVYFQFSYFYIPLLIYLIALILSTLFSNNPKQSFIKLAGEIYLIAICVLTFNIVRSIDMLKKVGFAWFLAMIVVCSIGTMTVISFCVFPKNSLNSFSLHHYGTLPPGNYPRIQTTFYYPAMLCHYLSIGLMILFAFFELNWISLKKFLFLLFIISITLLFTLTPGLGGVALSVGLWFFLIFKKNQKFFMARISLISGIVLAALIFLVTLVSPIQTPTSPYFVTIPVIEKRIDPSVRVLTWQSAFKTFLDYPLFGKGVGSDVASVNYLDASGNFQHLTDAHQLWISITAQEGIFGLLAILAITFYFLPSVFPLNFISKQEDVLNVGLNLAFISAFVYQGLVGSFEDARHLWVLLGLMLSVNKFKNVKNINFSIKENLQVVYRKFFSRNSTA